MRTFICVVAVVVAMAPSLAAQDLVKKFASDQAAPLDVKANVVYQVVIESDDFYPAADLSEFAGEFKHIVDMARLPKSKLKYRRDLFLLPSKAGMATIRVAATGKAAPNGKALDAAKGQYQLTLRPLDFDKKPLVEAKNTLKKEGDAYDYPLPVKEGKVYYLRLSTPAKAQIQAVVSDPSLPPEERQLFGDAIFDRDSGWFAFQARQTAKLAVRVESIGNAATEFKLAVFER